MLHIDGNPGLLRHPLLVAMGQGTLKRLVKHNGHVILSIAANHRPVESIHYNGSHHIPTTQA